jgi:hypothetical protein
MDRSFKYGSTYRAHKLGEGQPALHMTLPRVQHKTLCCDFWRKGKLQMRGH